ncbi:hypothetical protein KKA13_02505 [Patescibacteria group bacterium]|nr:hypothetical protein [Patescibacteria group bacterium]
MVTKMIGVKEFRQNIAGYYRQAKKNNWRYIILNRNKPIFEVTAIKRQNIGLEKLTADISDARHSIKKGKWYSEAEVRRKLGL